MASSSFGPIKEVFIKEKPISERPFEYLKPRLFFKTHQMLEFLPLPIIEIISHKVQNQHFAKLVAVKNYLRNLALNPTEASNRNLKISCSYFINPTKHCPDITN